MLVHQQYLQQMQTQSLKWIGPFQVGLLPRSTTILPFVAQLPPSDGVLYDLLTINDCPLVILGHNHGWILAVVHDGIQQDILISIASHWT